MTGFNLVSTAVLLGSLFIFSLQVASQGGPTSTLSSAESADPESSIFSAELVLLGTGNITGTLGGLYRTEEQYELNSLFSPGDEYEITTWTIAIEEGVANGTAPVEVPLQFEADWSNALTEIIAEGGGNQNTSAVFGNVLLIEQSLDANYTLTLLGAQPQFRFSLASLVATVAYAYGGPTCVMLKPLPALIGYATESYPVYLLGINLITNATSVDDAYAQLGDEEVAAMLSVCLTA